MLLILSFVGGCNSYSDRIVRKKIDVDSNRYLEWYQYGLLTGFSPSYIELKYKTSHERKLIIESGNICEILVLDDTIKVLAAHGDYNYFKNTVDEFRILLDTTCKGETLYK